MSDYLAIIRRNLSSPIVLAIFLLSLALLYLKEYRDAWFISFVVVVNVLISIIQESRARKALKKLEIMSAPKAKIMRDGEVFEIPYQELSVGDKIQLVAGDEVPADAKIIATKDIEINESMLTGESLSIEKFKGETIYAATTVTSGSATAKVLAVGDATKSGKINKKLKRYQPRLTPLQTEIQRAISIATIGAVVLAALVFVVYSFAGSDATTILMTITSSAITVVPEGLLLASSLLLAYGSLKLAQAKVLPQKLSAIEAMALLDILCVDKTGTLTSDDIDFDRLEIFEKVTEKQLEQLVAIVATEASSGNATGDAIIKACKKPKKYQIIEAMSFSSARKMSAVRVMLDDKIQTIFMGAPEFIRPLVPDFSDGNQQLIDKWTNCGQRVLTVAIITDQATPLKKIKSSNGKIVGAVLLTNPLRDGVHKTIDFLQSQDVTVKVISGDNPKTVSYIAGLAGIKNHQNTITGAELADLSESGFEEAANHNTIFARVLPEQKEKLIGYFRSQKLFTGMVGDGVNDALALKKADLGVAMYSGAAVSRRVSDIILLNNSFTALPLGLKLGNQIMQAIEAIAVLFFHKVIYGVILLLTTMALGLIYPYAPRHITFMNMFLVTMPTIMWTLFPPTPLHRVDPKRFWRETLTPIMLIALITGLTVSFTYWILSLIYVDDSEGVATMTVLTATFFGIYVVFLADKIFDVKINKILRFARNAYLFAVAIVVIVSFSITPLRHFFDFSAPTVWILWPALMVIAISANIQWRIAVSYGQNFNNSLNVEEKIEE